MVRSASPSPHAPPPPPPQGEWYQGRRHGAGSVFLPNGDRFVGSWKEGRIGGPVEYAFAEDSPWSNPDL